MDSATTMTIKKKTIDFNITDYNILLILIYWFITTKNGRKKDHWDRLDFCGGAACLLFGSMELFEVLGESGARLLCSWILFIGIRPDFCEFWPTEICWDFYNFGPLGLLWIWPIWGLPILTRTRHPSFAPMKNVGRF